MYGCTRSLEPLQFDIKDKYSRSADIDQAVHVDGDTVHIRVDQVERITERGQWLHVPVF